MIFALFFLTNCQPKKEEKIEVIIPIPKDLISYERDKKQIADCFINKIEYFRKYHDYHFEIYIDSPDSIKKRYSDYYSNHIGADFDPENFFIPYASRYNVKKEKSVASPYPTNEQIEVTTDAILYNKEELICFAFVVIERKFSKINGIGQAYNGFDARAVIGLRKNIDEPFEIYPVSKFDAINLGSYKSAVEDIKYLYFTMLKGDGLAGTQYEDQYRFNSNVGDADFFEKAPFFHKTKEGLYFFQLYEAYEGLKEFQYQKCNISDDEKSVIKQQ